MKECDYPEVPILKLLRIKSAYCPHNSKILNGMHLCMLFIIKYQARTPSSHGHMYHMEGVTRNKLMNKKVFSRCNVANLMKSSITSNCNHSIGTLPYSLHTSKLPIEELVSTDQSLSREHKIGSSLN